MLLMRNSDTTKYTKSIAISPEDLKFIEETKKKKSKAGKLSEIIKYYMYGNKLGVPEKPGDRQGQEDKESPAEEKEEENKKVPSDNNL